MQMEGWHWESEKIGVSMSHGGWDGRAVSILRLHLLNVDGRGRQRQFPRCMQEQRGAQGQELSRRATAAAQRASLSSRL